MSYPSLELYNEALQHLRLALVDPELKKGTVATTGLGLPLALCGGFALTYTVSTGSKRYAVRCFHRQSNALEQRYSAISNRLKGLRSPYFVDFEFQPEGVRVNGKSFPIVKMAWASGTTLGEFLEGRYRSKADLQQLGGSLSVLASFLEGQHIAHGDVQPGNLMVATGAHSIQLIDYDGMYVEDLKNIGSAELGHRNFQHPGRNARSWDSKLDRFSFIGLDLALRALEASPELWTKTQSDGEAVLFRANDFAEPGRSAIFGDLFARSQFAQDAKNFAAICKAPFTSIPTLEDFKARRNIPQVAITVSPIAPAAPARYLSAYPVLDATSYALGFRHVGDRVELVGKIVEVKQDTTRHGKPYVFINFGPWQGEIVKISVWSEGLAVVTQRPDQSWVGKWISVVGLMEPPYRSRKYKYSHLSITVTHANQIHFITESEAIFRLSGTMSRPSGSSPHSTNRELLDDIRGTATKPSRKGSSNRSAPATQNQAILQGMKGSQSSASSGGAASSGGSSASRHGATPTAGGGQNSGCLIWVVVAIVVFFLFVIFKR